MTVLMEEPRALDEFGELGELLDSLDLPPGYKAELIEGEIVVMPPPGFNHEAFLAMIHYQLSLRKWLAVGNLGVITPLGKFIPDLSVATFEYFRRDSDESWQGSDGIAMVVEVTSSNPEKDRDAKRRGYALANIPVYLLVDRQRKETVLFSEPERGDYVVVARRPITEPVPLPAPFSFTLTDIL